MNFQTIDVIVTGTLTELKENQVEVNARALKSENGSVLCAQRAVIEKDWREPRSSEESEAAVPEEDTKPEVKDNEAIPVAPPAAGVRHHRPRISR